MNRTGLFVAIAIAVVAGAVLGFFPQIELSIAAHFHSKDLYGNKFGWRIYPPLMLARDLSLWVGTAIIVPAVGALVVKLIWPRWKMLISVRAAIFLVVTMALGPGLLVNFALKEHWGRPRPIDVTQFGGDQHYVRWFDPRGDCPGNCSFVSGDVSGAFWTLAPAALTPPPWRPLAYAAALALGVSMGTIRVMAGGHFLSDAIFSGVFTYLIVWLVYALIYRWPRTRLSEETLEARLERATYATRRSLMWFGHRTANEIAGPQAGDETDRTKLR
jgi:membrane-associated PAP2 superfamily phosphatase